MERTLEIVMATYSCLLWNER